MKVERIKAKLVWIWRALNLDRAFRKGQQSNVGHTSSRDTELKTASVQINIECLADLGEGTRALLKKKHGAVYIVVVYWEC